MQIYELDPEFCVMHPAYSRKRIPLWRERIYCLGEHGCNPNPLASDHKHSQCSVEIICTIFGDYPEKMELSFVGDHGPNHKPPPCNLQERQLSFEVTQLHSKQYLHNIGQ